MTLGRWLLVLSSSQVVALFCMLAMPSLISADNHKNQAIQIAHHPVGGYCTTKMGGDLVSVSLGERVAVHGQSATCRYVDGRPILVFGDSE